MNQTDAGPSIDSRHCAEADVRTQADTPLQQLLAAVVAGRAALAEELRTRPSEPSRQMVRRRDVLYALEAYTAALSRRNLPLPPRLNSELALQRALVRKPRPRPSGRPWS